MKERHEFNETVDEPSAPGESLDAGLAAGFGKPADPPGTIDHDPAVAAADGSHPAGDQRASDFPTVPGYQVLREIARGGMGCVLAARDLTLDRDVALKILLPGANADRFVRESKITARLPHPGIPPVHALGTLADGSPFLAMKLIAGQTLADEMKSADRPRLLQVFTQVCQAVGFAHSRGVIHRDLKPANVMVGAFGEVQVMDWGLAKDLTSQGTADKPDSSHAPPAPCVNTDANQTTDHRGSGESTDDHTQAGQVMGTPAYMAPEQARGEAADARTDVFTLGGILCTILTAQPPFRGKSALEIIQRAGAADLAEANTRLDGCGADADLIALCRRCLSPRPANRPADSQAVADAMTAYLDGVQERLQATERERAVAVARDAEQRKRRTVQLALAAAVMVLLLGSGAVAWWQNEQMSEQRLAEERAATETARLTGERNAERARRQFEDEQRSAADRNRRARNTEAVTVLLGQCEAALRARDASKTAIALDAAHKRAGEGGAERQKPRLRRLAADLALSRALDDVDQFRWKRFPDGSAAATLIRKVLRRFGADPNSVSVHEAVARASGSLVRERIVAALDQLFRQEKAAAVRAMLRRLDADPYRNEVRDAVRDNDEKKLRTLAGRADALKQPPEFAAFLGENKAIRVEQRRQLLLAGVRQRPGNLDLLMTLGLTYANEKNHVNEQLRWFQAAVAAAPDNAVAHNNLGNALAEGGELDAAIACFKKTLAINANIAGAHINLGTALNVKGRLDEAIAFLQKAIDIDPNSAMACTSLGVALKDKGKLDEAIAFCKKAIAINPKLALAHNNLGNALAEKGNEDAAIACYQKAVALDPKYASAHNNLGMSRYSKGELGAAIACYKKAIALDPKLALAHNNLGVALSVMGQVDAAITSIKKAIALDPKLALAHNNLGNELSDRGEVGAAIACYEKAIAINPKLAQSHNNLGNARSSKGELDAAIACYKTAIEINPKYARPYYGMGNALGRKGELGAAVVSFKKAIELGPEFAEAHCNLGGVLARQGRFVESLAAYKRGHELGRKRPGWRYPSAAWVRRAEERVALEKKLGAFLKGEHKPKGTAERLDLAGICHPKKLHQTAAGLYADIFAAQPKLASDLKRGYRYNAACSAALAAAGTGKDAAKLDDEAKTRLRKQALDWLRADLALWTKIRQVQPLAAVTIQKTLKDWQTDHDLAAVRDDKELARLPSAEQTVWVQLWSDVEALRKKAADSGKEETLKGTLTAVEREHAHEVKMKAGTNYAIEMASRQFDTYLRLENTQKKVLAENDDIDLRAKNLNSRIYFTPKKDGVYRIIATSYQQRGQGAYTLVIREFRKEGK